MSVLVLATALLSLISIAFIILIILRLRRPAEKPCPEWLHTFSLGPYEPMLQALGDGDLSFISGAAGFHFCLPGKLRRERTRIFRNFLNRYIHDYNRLHALARASVASSTTDQSGMFIRLMQLRLTFSLSLFRAEMAYALSRTGLGTASAQILLPPLERVNGGMCKVILDVVTAT